MDVEVDPALFVKCRLCLDQMGMYQIIPAVQQQIHFCYEIEVSPYDGLSQLICRICKNILTNYHTIKTDYIEKQNILRSKTNKKVNATNEPKPQEIEIDMVSSSQQMDVEEDSNGREEKRTRRQSSISHSDVSDVVNKNTAKNNLKPIKKQNAKFVWKYDFDKKFACRICRKHFSKRISVIKHSSTHIKQYKKFKHVLTKICTVALNKTNNSDSLPTHIDTVKYSPNKILQEQGILEYNIVYVRKNNDLSQTLVHDQYANDNKVNDSSRESPSQDFTGKRRRRNRILSNSSDDFSNDAHSTKSQSSQKNHSNLEKLTNSSTKEVECINIDDTSTESTSCNDNNVSLHSTTDKENVENTIHHICMMCNNKYINKINRNVEEKKEISDLHLQNKILNLGRKIIFKQGFRNTGLLSFLEKKNLKVIWIPQKLVNVDYVRIFTKLNSKESDDGWKKVDRAQFSNSDSSQLLVHLFKENIYDAALSSSSSSVITKEPSNLESHLVENSLPEPSVSVNDITKNIDSECNSKNKLLNANPVANPKQLPKKINAISWIDNTENISKESNLLQQNEANNSEICMPVITSTTSLAPINKEKPDTNNEQTNLKNTARIKVKPVTELLSKYALNSLHQHQQELNTHVIWNQNENHMIEHNNTQGLTETVPTNNASFTPPEHPFLPVTIRDKENMTLDTIELPNTKTESPFHYFGNLLNMHGINLLPANTILHNGFCCLIKYKAEFKQEATQEPKGVALSLSLFGFDSNFCLQIRDKYQIPIDISKISAHWEWEILKTYTGDVSKKILKNSQKIKENLFKHARTFVSLLESIKVVKVP